MIFNGETCAFIWAPPDWGSTVELSLEVPSDKERGLTGRERRQALGSTLRATLRWQSILGAAQARALRDELNSLPGVPAITPCWPLMIRGADWSASLHCAGGIWVAWDEGQTPQITSSGGLNPADFDWFAPGLFGQLQIDEIELLRPDLVRVQITLIEDAQASYAITAPAQLWPQGPALNDSATPFIFPLPADWSRPIGGGIPSVEIVRHRLAAARRAAIELYPQSPVRGYHAGFRLLTPESLALLLRWWIDRAASVDAHYILLESETGSLAVDATQGATQITLSEASTLGSFRYLALRDPVTYEVARILSLAGNVATLAAPLAHSWPAAGTVVGLAALARLADQELRLRFDAPHIAIADLAWREVPEEYIIADGETRGETVGRTPSTAWLYEFTADICGSQSIYRYTGYETDLTVSGQVYDAIPIEHTTLTASLDLMSDEVTIRCRFLSVLSSFLPAQLSARVLIAISECDVVGATGTNVVRRWSGEIVKAEFTGPMASLTARGQYAQFARLVPRYVIQPQCNHTLFDARCGLSQAAWTFTAQVASGTGNSVTLNTWARPGGLPAGWGFANYFALGYVERAGGERLPILASTALSGGAVTLTLDRAPATAWTSAEPVSVLPGCDGRAETCKAWHSTNNPEGKFDNFQRFGGMPWVPAKNPSFTAPKRTANAYGKK